MDVPSKNIDKSAIGSWI